MERGYRLVAGAIAGRWHRSVTRSRVATVLLAVLLAGAGTAFSSGSDEAEELAATPESERLPIIVNLLVGEEVGSEDTIAAVTTRVMERLRAKMSDEDLAAIRTFTFFPVIALSADQDLIFRLLSMPEVISIERDHEIRVLEDASLELVPPQDGMPAPSESEPTLDAQEPNLDLQVEQHDAKSD